MLCTVPDTQKVLKIYELLVLTVRMLWPRDVKSHAPGPTASECEGS